MGSAPTFNIEIEGINQNIAHDIIEQLDKDYEINRIDDNSSEIIFDDFKLLFAYLESPSEYRGNSGKGVTIQYKPYYSESMDELFPKLRIMEMLQGRLNGMDILSDYDVEYYTAGSTL